MAHYVGLYYPFIHFKNDAWLKLTALYWDKMGRIVPETYRTEDTDTVKQLAEQAGYIETFRPTWVRPEFGEKFVRFLETHADRLRKRYDVSERHKWPNLPPELMPPPQGGLSAACCRNTGEKCSYNSYLFGKIALQYDGEPRSAKAALELPRQPG
jgi:hypothetical protein